jgi:hypothetical protein
MPDDTQVQAPEMILKSEYDKLAASVQAKEAGWQGSLQQYQTKTKDLENQLAIASQSQATLKQQYEAAQTSLAEAAAKAAELDALRVKTERLEKLVDFPDVLIDPALRRLAVTSSLPLDELTELLGTIKKQEVAPAPQPVQSPVPVDPGTPGPSTGNFNPGPTRDSLMTEIATALNAGDFEAVNRLSDQLAKLK